MSIYRSLGTPEPLVAYWVLHQPSTATDPEQYTGNMRRLHTHLRDAFHRAEEGWKQVRAESVRRTTDRIQGELLGYLTTPLSSDLQKIRESTASLILESQDNAGTGVHPLFGASSEAVLFADEPGVPSASFRSALRALGFRTVKSSPPVCESLFLVRGGVGLDVLEIIVRDRIGIYANEHGVHIRESARYTFSAFNLVPKPEKGLPVRPAAELVVWFPKGDEKYAPFRKRLLEECAACDDQFGGTTLVLQRKLGLGVHHEFQLRVPLRERGQARDVATYLKKRPAGSVLGRISKQGDMVLSLSAGQGA